MRPVQLIYFEPVMYTVYTNGVNDSALGILFLKLLLRILDLLACFAFCLKQTVNLSSSKHD